MWLWLLFFGVLSTKNLVYGHSLVNFIDIKDCSHIRQGNFRATTFRFGFNGIGSRYQLGIGLSFGHFEQFLSQSTRREKVHGLFSLSFQQGLTRQDHIQGRNRRHPLGQPTCTRIKFDTFGSSGQLAALVVGQIHRQVCAFQDKIQFVQIRIRQRRFVFPPF